MRRCSILAFLLATATTITTTTALIQVIGGSGRMGSQWMRLLREEAVAVPRGSVLVAAQNNSIAVVCTSAAAWPSLRRMCCSADLIFVGNGLIDDDDDDATYVIPHYAITAVGAPPNVQEGAPPTYVVGPHAPWVQHQLESDGILNVELLDDHTTAQQHAVRKLLWASVMWLLCHGTSETPITVKTVHTTQADSLRRLVQELWPTVCERMRLDGNNNNSTVSTHVLFEETLQYLQDYSLSIPTAIPSVALALAELEVRNAIFAGPNQPLHRALLEQVAGTERTNNMFASTRTTTNNNEDVTTCFVPLPSLGITVSGNRRQQHKQRKRIVIIGAGIVGSSIALHLSSSPTHDVTVVDTGDALTSTTTTSRASWAWINANQKRPLYYQHLNAWGMHVWRHHPELQDLVDWTGTLVRRGRTNGEEDNESLGGFYARPQGPLTAATWLALEPNAGFPQDDDECGVYHYPNEGCVDPMEAVSHMRTLAQQQGTKFLWNSHVESVEEIAENDGNKHTTTHIRILDMRKKPTPSLTADTVIIAAGVGTTALCGLPMRHSPGRIAVTKETNGRLHKILVDTVEKTHILQRRNGDLVIGGGELEVGGSSPTSSNQRIPSESCVGPTSGSANTIPDLTTLETSNDEPFIVAEALRPIPQDGLPCIGFLRPGYYVATTHSGITLAPLVGALVALEVGDDIDLDMLQNYRPRRLFSASSA